MRSRIQREVVTRQNGSFVKYRPRAIDQTNLYLCAKLTSRFSMQSAHIESASKNPPRSFPAAINGSMTIGIFGSINRSPYWYRQRMAHDRRSAIWSPGCAALSAVSILQIWEG